ncbi:MAG TPA: hypothetical protein VF810_02825 [Patescibacteria group bacterium]
MKNTKIFFSLYLLTLLGFFIYSFTQIDLSLTFSRIDFLRHLVSNFQYIGYFNRPLSTFLFIFFIILLFNFYVGFCIMAYTKQIKKKTVWKLIIATILILIFSYNAFSYDIFNYIFDAKIITHYHQNPYIHKALDYPGDPMLSFMRWTHRVYPYGPLWLVLTVPLSFIGFGFFLPTFFMFKALVAAAFLGSIYYIGKILQKIAPDKEIFGLVFFGLQPLIVIESLISGHLDIVMFFFALWSFHLLLNKKYLWSLVILLISIGIKFATAFLLPIFILIIVLQKLKKPIPWRNTFILTIILMLTTVILASLRSNFQPWYLIAPLAFATFLGFRYFVFIPSLIISFVALLTYVPFLYSGNWNPPIPQILNTLYMVGIAVAFIATTIYSFVRKK